MTKHDLPAIVEEAIRAHGGRATVVQVAQFTWDHYEVELRASGDLFYTWQYDIRWAATRLREERKLVDANISPRGVWELAQVETASS